MRTDLIGGLLGAVAHNLARGADRVALFESGRVYLPERPPAEGGVLDGRFPGLRAAPVREPHRIGCVIVRPGSAGVVARRSRPSRLLRGKGLVELLADALGVELDFEPGDRGPSCTRRGPLMSACGGPRSAGSASCTPACSKRIGSPAAVAFELDAGPLLAAADRGDRELPRRDHSSRHRRGPRGGRRALDPRRAVEADRPRGRRRAAAVRPVFDVYEGEQVAEGKRSLALRLEFRAPDRTLTDAEVAERREAIVEALGAIGASLRG